jgi:hypothetical protein
MRSKHRGVRFRKRPEHHPMQRRPVYRLRL